MLSSQKLFLDSELLNIIDLTLAKLSSTITFLSLSSSLLVLSAWTSVLFSICPFYCSSCFLLMSLSLPLRIFLRASLMPSDYLFCQESKRDGRPEASLNLVVFKEVHCVLVLSKFISTKTFEKTANASGSSQELGSSISATVNPGLSALVSPDTLRTRPLLVFISSMHLLMLLLEQTRSLIS